MMTFVMLSTMASAQGCPYGASARSRASRPASSTRPGVCLRSPLNRQNSQNPARLRHAGLGQNVVLTKAHK